MMAMIFEVWPKAEHKQDYLERAAQLRSLVESIDGFVSIERFESLYQPAKLLSLGFFRNEAALAAWRSNAEHRIA
jgi:heme-degrading monooxygenase HmoA